MQSALKILTEAQETPFVFRHLQAYLHFKTHQNACQLLEQFDFKQAPRELYGVFFGLCSASNFLAALVKIAWLFRVCGHVFGRTKHHSDTTNCQALSERASMLLLVTRERAGISQYTVHRGRGKQDESFAVRFVLVGGKSLTLFQFFCRQFLC